LVFKNRFLSKRYGKSYAVLLIVVLELTLFISYGLSRTENVSGFYIKDQIYPNETVNYNFYNNITLGISSDTFIDIEIDYENRIENRQIFFIINNSVPINLNIASKIAMNNFGFSKAPRNPRSGNSKYQYRYNCIFQIRTNTTIENLTIQSIKKSQFGFEPAKRYSLALYRSSQESWEIVDTITENNVSSSEELLVSKLSLIQADTDYYITFLEISPIVNEWFWIILIVLLAVGIGSLVILISKKDYFQYLKTRTVPIEKGAHRLSLDEVLENENRNKIIDLILNEPGIHFNELLRKTGLAAGNLVWHLDILETYKVIGKKRIGKFIAYFAYYQKNPIDNLNLKLSKSKLTLEILEMIEREPGLWNNLITKRMKVDHKTIQYHLEKLKDLNLVNIKKDGRKKKIFPNLDSEYFTNNKSN